MSVNENGDGYMTFNRGIPVSFTAINTPYYQWPRLDADLGLYITDTWHFKRVAITAGLRWEYLAGQVESVNAPAGRFARLARSPTSPATTTPAWAAGRTGRRGSASYMTCSATTRLPVKAGFGKYNTPYSTGFTNNFNPMTSSGRSL